MKKTNFTWHNLKLWLAVFLLGMSVAGSAQTYNAPVFNIADGPNSAVIPVSCVGNIANGANVTVSVRGVHTWNADLQMFLVAPTGQTVELMTSIGGSSDHFNLTFSDAAATNISAAPVGTGAPAGTAANCANVTAFALNGTFSVIFLSKQSLAS